MILREERVIVGADLNGHVGVGNNEDVKIKMKMLWAGMGWAKGMMKDRQW